jgi:hypothetical protein
MAELPRQSAMRWRRIVAGLYESEDGRHRIVWCSAEGCGPRGGTAVSWELMVPDRTGGWYIDMWLGRTLREAKERYEREVRHA